MPFDLGRMLFKTVFFGVAAFGAAAVFLEVVAIVHKISFTTTMVLYIKIIVKDTALSTFSLKRRLKSIYTDKTFMLTPELLYVKAIFLRVAKLIKIA